MIIAYCIFIPILLFISGFAKAVIPSVSKLDWQPVTIEATIEDITGGQIIIDFEYSKLYTPL